MALGDRVDGESGLIMTWIMGLAGWDGMVITPPVTSGFSTLCTARILS